MYIRISCPDVLSNLHLVIMQDMYRLRHRGLAKKGHAQPLKGTPKGLMLMVALPTLKDPPTGTLKGPLMMVALPTLKDPPMGTLKRPLLMVALPTLKDPPVGTLMEQMLMLALSTHKESLMIK